MRQIKFRACYKSDKKMMYRGVYDRNWYTDPKGGKAVIPIHPNDQNTMHLMQWTGLKDKNGKDIYEGDILKIPDDWDSYGWMAGEIREVYYLEGSYRLKPKQNLNGRGHLLDNEVAKFEIIGNIYQNKDLIKTL